MRRVGHDLGEPGGEPLALADDGHAVQLDLGEDIRAWIERELRDQLAATERSSRSDTRLDAGADEESDGDRARRRSEEGAEHERETSNEDCLAGAPASRGELLCGGLHVPLDHVLTVAGRRCPESRRGRTRAISPFSRSDSSPRPPGTTSCGCRYGL